MPGEPCQTCIANADYGCVSNATRAFGQCQVSEMLTFSQRVDRLEPFKSDGRCVRRIQQLEYLVMYDRISELNLAIKGLQDLIFVERPAFINF